MALLIYFPSSISYLFHFCRSKTYIKIYRKLTIIYKSENCCYGDCIYFPTIWSGNVTFQRISIEPHLFLIEFPCIQSFYFRSSEKAKGDVVKPFKDQYSILLKKAESNAYEISHTVQADLLGINCSMSVRKANSKRFRRGLCRSNFALGIDSHRTVLLWACISMYLWVCNKKNARLPVWEK